MGFLQEAWNAAQTQPQQRKPARKPVGKPATKKVKDKKPLVPMRICELCGRQFRSQHGIWCNLCVRFHSLYPTPCETCDNGYHFPPGLTEITDIMHLARIVDTERMETEYRLRIANEPKDLQPF